MSTVAWWIGPLIAWYVLVIISVHIAEVDNFEAELFAVLLFMTATVGCAFSAFLLHLLTT